MDVPSQRIDQIRLAIENGTATADEIELYADWKAELAAKRAESEALTGLVARQIEERIKESQANAELAHEQLADLLRQSEERLKAAQNGE